MITRGANLLNKRNFISRFAQLNSDQLGDIYVKFLEPVKVEDFLKAKNYTNFNIDLTEKAAVELS